jgi:hypothetical protein
MKDQRLSPTCAHLIKVQLEDGNIADCEIRSFSRYRSDKKDGISCLELCIVAIGDFSATAHNYFDAMIKLRNKLESKKVKLLCFGARKDAWASGMQRDMGAGLVAYLLSSPDKENLVQQSIFDYAPIETIGTPDEQKDYAVAWLDERPLTASE